MNGTVLKKAAVAYETFATFFECIIFAITSAPAVSSEFYWHYSIPNRDCNKSFLSVSVMSLVLFTPCSKVIRLFPLIVILPFDVYTVARGFCDERGFRRAFMETAHLCKFLKLRGFNVKRYSDLLVSFSNRTKAKSSFPIFSIFDVPSISDFSSPLRSIGVELKFENPTSTI